MPENRDRLLNVFLCHSYKDLEAARALYIQLTNEGWMDVWFREVKLKLDMNWQAEIERAIKSSDVIILLISHKSVSKKGGLDPELDKWLELSRSGRRRSPVISSLRLDNCAVPENLQSTKMFDYFPKNQRDIVFQNLLEDLIQRAKRRRISTLKRQVSDESEAGIQWTPTRWKELASESEPPDPFETEDLQKSRRRFLSGISSLLAILVCGLTINYLVHHMPPSSVSKPTLSPTSTPIPLPTPTLGVGSIRISPVDHINMVFVPAGRFIMGGDVYYEEQPIHSVNLNAFWMDQTEVTNAAFANFLNETGNRLEGGVTWLDAKDDSVRIHFRDNSWQADQGYENHPVVEVTWHGANAYCSWAGRRLPTEAEWEKAARGTTANIYPWGNNEPNADLLNFNKNVGDTTEVGSYPNGASPYGALDMAGNIWEWTADWYARTYYSSPPSINPQGPDSGIFRVLRGGAWSYRDTYARSMNRNAGAPYISHDFIGFRCASS